MKTLNVILRRFLTQKGFRQLQEVFVQLYMEIKLNPGFDSGDLGDMEGGSVRPSPNSSFYCPVILSSAFLSPFGYEITILICLRHLSV